MLSCGQSRLSELLQAADTLGDGQKRFSKLVAFYKLGRGQNGLYKLQVSYMLRCGQNGLSVLLLASYMLGGGHNGLSDFHKHPTILAVV